LCQIGNSSKEYLAKFGYRPDTKVEEFKIPFIFWLLLELVVEI
jgi:hypothetical protein